MNSASETDVSRPPNRLTTLFRWSVLARDHVPYYLWHQQRFLETTEGNIVHYSHIECHIEALGERFDIHEITFDRWGAIQMSQNLDDARFTVVPFGQGGVRLTRPIGVLRFL